MRKKIALIVLLSFVITFISLMIFLLSRSSNRSNNASLLFSPTPIQLQQPSSGAPQVLETQPKATEDQAPVDQPIIISFDKTVSPTDFTFSIKPSIEYTTSINGHQFTVTPKNPLQPGTTYEYVIDYHKTGQQPELHVFTTAGGQGFPNPTSNMKSIEKDYDLQYAPDVYLSNHVSENTNADFSIDASYTAQPQSHFYFVVRLTTSNAKQEFLDWLRSIGLSDTQIQTLDLRYQ